MHSLERLTIKREQGLHEVYREGSNGCLGTYWCGWCLTGEDRWSLGSIMWVWWKRFLLNQEMQDMNRHYISHWCLPHSLVSHHKPPLVHVGGTAASLLHWGEGLTSPPGQSDLSRYHLWKVNITYHALSELWTQQTHSTAHNDIHYPSPHTTTVASGTQWQSYSCRVTTHEHCTKWSLLVQMRMLNQSHWCTPTLTTCMNLTDRPLLDPRPCWPSNWVCTCYASESVCSPLSPQFLILSKRSSTCLQSSGLSA